MHPAAAVADNANMGTLGRRLPRARSRAGFAALALASALTVAPGAAPARAQGTPGARPASWLTIESHERGTVTARVGLPGGALDSAAVFDALARAFGSPVREPVWVPTARFDFAQARIATVRTKDGGRQLRFDPQPVVERMRATGAPVTTIYLSLPQPLPFRLEPTRDPDWSGVVRGNRFAVLRNDAPHASVVFAFGWSPLERTAAATTAAGLLLLPWLASAWIVERTRRDAAGRTAGAWFRGMQWLQWLLVASTLATTVAAMDSVLARMVRVALAEAWGPWGTLGAAALALVPLASATVASVLAQHAIAECTRGGTFTRRELLAMAAWSTGSLAGLVLGFAGAAVLVGQGFVAPAIAAALAGLVAAGACRQRLAKRQGMELIALSSGELRDRVTALAKAAGVRLGQLYVVPMSRSRMANAFAVRADVVVLTDWLVEQLERREVDAILAHELGHLKLRHTRWLALASVAAASLVGSLAVFVPMPAVIALAVLAMILAPRMLSRRFEGAADAQAVKLCGDPEALIRALVRVSHLNHVPVSWSVSAEKTLTHPSTERRAHAIGAAAGLSAERIAELLADPGPVTDRYALPATATPGGKAFSTTWKAAAARRVGLWTLLAGTFAPAAAFAATAMLHWPRLASVPVALACAFFAMLGVADLLGSRIVLALKARLVARLTPARGAHFVTLAPGPAMRVYEGFYDWDLGFLAIEDDALAYTGEEASLRIPRACVDAVELHPGPPSWLAAPRVALAWSDPATGRNGVLLLRPAEATTVLSLRVHAAMLAQDLRAWCARTPAGAEHACSPAPPQAEDVSGIPLRRALSPATLVPVAILVLPFAILVCALLQLPLVPWTGAGALETWLVAVAATALLRLPGWLVRERRAAAPGNVTRRAA